MKKRKGYIMVETIFYLLSVSVVISTLFFICMVSIKMQKYYFDKTYVRESALRYMDYTYNDLRELNSNIHAVYYNKGESYKKWYKKTRGKYIYGDVMRLFYVNENNKKEDPIFQFRRFCMGVGGFENYFTTRGWFLVNFDIKYALFNRDPIKDYKYNIVLHFIYNGMHYEKKYSIIH